MSDETPFRYAENLTEKTLRPIATPADFQVTEQISEQVKHDKVARQEWYRNTGTRHCFWTLVEPANPNQRATSKDNPPRLLHGVVADYDVPIPVERVADAIKAMKRKPSFVERSIGGNWRVVWLFFRPLPVDTTEFCTFMLKTAKKWLALDMLPGLDEPALLDPTRLYCRGTEFSATGLGPISEAETQAFFVECGSGFCYTPADRVDIPLDVVEQECRRLFPNFSWPVDFALESQGPSFWVPGSVSAMSAIVKRDGMFTFSAHAARPFYSWREILGADFCKKWEVDTMAAATGGCFFDGRKFWRRMPDGSYKDEDKADFTDHLLIDCRLSRKVGKDGISPLGRALQHIRNHQRVDGAAPLIFQPKGQVINYNGASFLNTAEDNLVRPADELTEWGPGGQFPFISQMLDTVFASAEQTEHFVSWLSHFYKNAVKGNPVPGQNIFIAGAPGIGKTLLNLHVVGRLMGGFIDCRDYVMGDDKFGGQLFRFPVWAIDDETISDTEAARVRFNAFIKKLAANQTFLYHQKFEKPVSIYWSGRVIVTLNLDYISCRSLPQLDMSAADKINVYRGPEEPKMKFPERHAIRATLENELPYFGRYLAEFTVPEKFKGDVRYGISAYQEPSLVVRAHQTSRASTFRELLIETLKIHFQDHPEDQYWDVTAVQLNRAISSNPLNVEILRSLRTEMLARHLESMERSHDLGVTTRSNDFNVRCWRFPRL